MAFGSNDSCINVIHVILESGQRAFSNIHVDMMSNPYARRGFASLRSERLAVCHLLPINHVNRLHVPHLRDHPGVLARAIKDLDGAPTATAHA